jgi:hypothetical protein
MNNARRITSHTFLALLEAMLVASLLVVLVSGTAFAAKGGGGKKGGGGATLTATVVVAPNPVPAYSTFQITGCGYKPNSGVQFTLYAPGVTAVWGGTADGSGCLVNASGWANAAGSAKLDVLEGSVTKVASTSFTIK